MKKIKNLPFFEVEFNKTAGIEKPQQVTDLFDGITSEQLTDLIIISHGWNNDMAEAEVLYTSMMELLDSELLKTKANGRKFGVLGIYWPSKKFADQDLIPGGAAGIDSKENDAIILAAEHLKDFFDGADADLHLQTIQKVAEQAKTGSADNEELYDALTKLFSPITSNVVKQPDEDAIADFKNMEVDQLLMRLEVTEEEPLPEPGFGGAATVGNLARSGGADGGAGLGSWLSGIKNGLFNVLNLATYYQMKDRAGKVGTQALNPIIRDIKKDHPDIKFHLIGHSFGARLVTSAIVGIQQADAIVVQSLILLQAAFSHYGFAENFDGTQNGLFRSIITDKNVKGVMVVSHSKQDKAVGYAYPLASRVARQIASAFGGKDDPYGGLGSNGALKSGAIDTVNLTLNAAYKFEAGKIYNLNADVSITGHGDISNPSVAQVIAAVIT